MEQLNLFEIEPVEAEQPEKTEPVKAEPEIEEKEPEEIQPAPERPIWQAKRVRARKDVGWQVSDGYRTWFRAFQEYECFPQFVGGTWYLTLFDPKHRKVTDGVIAWASYCNDDPNYRICLDDAFFLEHFWILEWDEEAGRS